MRSLRRRWRRWVLAQRATGGGEAMGSARPPALRDYLWSSERRRSGLRTNSASAATVKFMIAAMTNTACQPPVYSRGQPGQAVPARPRCLSRCRGGRAGGHVFHPEGVGAGRREQAEESSPQVKKMSAAIGTNVRGVCPARRADRPSAPSENTSAIVFSRPMMSDTQPKNGRADRCRRCR